MVETVTISLPKNLLEKIDKKRAVMGYVSRSEFIREAAREKLEREEEEGIDLLNERGK